LAVAGSGIVNVTVEAGNPFLRISGDFLLDFRGVRLIRFFGSEAEVTVSNEIESISIGCFHGESVLSVKFTPGSHIVNFCELAFAASALQSICIPSSVETISKSCFNHCADLSQLAFDTGSKLSIPGESAFARCSSLQSICLPSSIEALPSRCFFGCSRLSTVTFERGSVVRILGERAFGDCMQLRSISIPSTVAIIDMDCFSNCSRLSTVAFEPGSRLSIIGKAAFSWCLHVNQIYLPASVRTIAQDCFLGKTRLTIVLGPGLNSPLNPWRGRGRGLR
jgi:hypothetical protein